MIVVYEKEFGADFETSRKKNILNQNLVPNFQKGILKLIKVSMIVV